MKENSKIILSFDTSTIMKILVSDYSGHPFTFELSQHLSKRNEVIHGYAQYFETPKANFNEKLQGKNLKIFPIKINKKFKKDNFLLRRSMDISYGNKMVDLIKVQKPNIVICSNTPLDPLNKITSYCKENKIKSIFWMQDIYSVAINKILKKKIPLLGRIIGFYYFLLEKKCEYNSDKIVVIASNFKKFIDKKNLSKTSVIENWSPIIKPKKRIIKFYKRKFNPLNKFCFIYSGTLGYKHNFKLFIKIAERFPEAVIIISSSGKFASKLKEISKKQLPNIKVTNWVNYNNFSSFLSIADAFIVTLDSDASTFSVPSKIYAYLTIGKPILGSMPLENFGSKKIKRMKAGYISKPGDNKTFMNNCAKLINSKKLRKIFFKNSKNYLKTRQASIDRMITNIEQLKKK